MLSPSTFKQKAAEKKAADRVFNDDDDDDDYRIPFPLSSARQKSKSNLLESKFGLYENNDRF